jgi:hypothetical protein
MVKASEKPFAGIVGEVGDTFEWQPQSRRAKLPRANNRNLPTKVPR